MGFIGAIIVGLIVGALAKLVMPGKDPGGIVLTILLGIGGAVVAGLLGRTFGWYEDAGSGPGILASTIGAIVILAIYRMAVGRSVRT